MGDSWVEATRDQYDDDSNLAARQAAFAYLVDADPLPPPLSDFSALSGRSVLDVGCGNGMFLAGAIGGGARAVGLDRSAGMLASAAEAAPGAPLLVADAVWLPVADDAVDVTMALWMLYHVDDIPAAVAELRRVTRADGLVVVSTNTGRRSFLDDLVDDALAATLDDGESGVVESWIPPLAFSSENGAQYLEQVFPAVETHEGGNRFEFTDTEVVVRYVASMLGPIAARNPRLADRPAQQRLLTEVGLRAERQIIDNGSVELSQRRAVFLCRS